MNLCPARSGQQRSITDDSDEEGPWNTCMEYQTYSCLVSGLPLKTQQGGDES